MVSEIQAPVRSEWVVNSGLPRPASKYSELLSLPLPFAKAFLQLSIHLNLTTPCPDPGLAYRLPGDPRLSRGPSDWGPHAFAPPLPLAL